MKILILFIILFLHIVADFNLQGILANMKQKKWWAEQTTDESYKNDYIVALLIHGFSWSFMVHLPIIVMIILYSKYGCVTGLALSLLAQAVLHAIVDHNKANLHLFNLIEDQLLHLSQIIIIWVITILMP